MDLCFQKSTLDGIQSFFDRYVLTLSSPFESYFEEQVLLSEHFLIIIDSKEAGYFSIKKRELITQFYLDIEYRHLGQKVFYEVKKMQHVQAAFVFTGDSFFLSHAMDEHRSIERQAYFFQDSDRPVTPEDVEVRLALKEDYDLVVELSGDFFDKIEERIEKEEIYIATKGGQVVGFGIVVKGILLKEYASIGMYTIENLRQKGIGRGIILGLKQKTYEMGLIPLAGCWYYNHFSKKTLESAGMYSDLRLLKIKY